MIIKSIATLLIFWILLSVNFATSPQPPLFEYSYSGHLVCDGIKSKENYTLRLFGKNEFRDSYTALSGIQIENETSIIITDTTGYYFLTVNSYEPFDSLKVGIVLPDKPIFLAELIV